MSWKIDDKWQVCHKFMQEKKNTEWRNIEKVELVKEII